MWPFSRKIKHLEAIMSQQIDALASRIDHLSIEVRALIADNLAKTGLILEAQERINGLEARLAAQPATEADLAALSASLAEIEAALNPAPVEAPAAPDPALSA